jgi:hypothetical protein
LDVLMRDGLSSDEIRFMAMQRTPAPAASSGRQARDEVPAI